MSERARMPYDTSRNGLYTFRPYVYGGTGEDVITPDRPGAAMQRRVAVVDSDGRCVACGYKASGQNHRAVCGVSDLCMRLHLRGSGTGR